MDLEEKKSKFYHLLLEHRFLLLLLLLEQIMKQTKITNMKQIKFNKFFFINIYIYKKI